MQALHLFNKNSSMTFNRVLLFCFPIFFIFLADSVMSYMFPILVAKTTQSNTMLGIIMALSSVLGIFCDFTFPMLLRNRSWRFQLLAGIVIALLFPIFSNLGAIFSFIFFFVLATLVWGVYYEFLQFCQQSFVTKEDSPNDYSKDWGILFLISEITTNIGPIIGSFLITQHVIVSNLTVNIFQIVSFLFALIVMINIPNRRTSPPESHIRNTVNVIKELLIWKKVGERLWPVILTGIMISFINASYWTIGGLLGLEIAGDSGYDWLVMVLFGLPLMVGALILTKIKVTQRKKRFSNISLMLGGLILATIFFVKNQPVIVLGVIILSSLALSFAGPLNEAVYSDLLERSGKSKLHLLGMAKSTTSFAYILAPLLTGFLSDRTDYYTTLSVVGASALILGVLLIAFTPRKIKLPQQFLGKI